MTANTFLYWVNEHMEYTVFNFVSHFNMKSGRRGRERGQKGKEAGRGERGRKEGSSMYYVTLSAGDHSKVASHCLYPGY